MRYVYGLLGLLLSCTPPETKTTPTRSEAVTMVHRATDSLYRAMQLDTLKLDPDAFDLAWRGMQTLAPKKPILLIADMSRPSSEKRLYVLQLAEQKVLFHTYVAHGRRSGGLRATQFSNVVSSNQTSLGFYRTLGRYNGKHGLSLKLRGLEEGINDNVFARDIVLHGADYVCEDTIRVTGQLGNSEGCPAIPNAQSRAMVKAVEGGACLFIYYPDSTYLKTSLLLNPARQVVSGIAPVSEKRTRN